MGVNGKVGQAAAQIATWQGARVIGVVRKAEGYVGHANGPVDVVNSSTQDVGETVKAMTDGKGADIVFNTVGDPYYQDAVKATAKRGKQILISAVDKIVQMDVMAFYRAQHTYYGVDSLSQSSTDAGTVLQELVPGFTNGALKPYPIEPHAIYPLRDAARAYVAVLGSSRDRLVLDPKA